jgi:hypothetical protein
MARIRSKLRFCAALLALGATARGQTPTDAPETYVRGIAGRLPIYAATNAPREAVAWLPGDTVLRVLGELEDDAWVPVAAPDAVSAWIYRDLVRDGTVVADKSQVRSGAGMAFRPIVSLDRGAPVTVRGVYGDWIKIKPPPDAGFWVLRDQVEPLAAWPRKEDDPPAQPDLYAALIEALTHDTPATAEPDAPSPSGPGRETPPAVPPLELNGYLLEDAPAQGERVTLSGTLDWGGVDAVTAPFRLIARDASGDATPLCNLLAPEITYGPRIGTRMTVEGTRWNVKGSRLPFIIPLNVRTDE